MGAVKNAAIFGAGVGVGFYATCKFYDNDPGEFIEFASSKARNSYAKVLASVKAGNPVKKEESSDDFEDDFDEDLDKPVEEQQEEQNPEKVEAEIVEEVE